MEFNLPKGNSVECAEYNLPEPDVEDSNMKTSLKEIPRRFAAIEEATHFPSYKSGNGVICPDDELAEKIRNQLEYLFSDDNIRRDKFLLKHVCQNEDGFVSLKLLLSMKKVRMLSKDWRVVAYSLKDSKNLELNEDMTKVRRIQPISTSCPAALLEIQTSDDFKNTQKFDEVTSMSVVSSSSDILRSPTAQRFCNFKKILSSLSAVKLSSLADPHDTISTLEKDFDVVSLMTHKSPSPSMRRSPSKLGMRWNRSNSDDSRWTDDSCDASSSPTYEGYRSSGRRRSSRDRSNRTTNSTDSEDYQSVLSYRYKSDGAINASWKQRRQLSASCDKKRVIVIRQPKGPDGTIGFHAGRSRMNLKSHRIMSDFEL